MAIECPIDSLEEWLLYWQYGNETWRSDVLSTDDLANDLAYGVQEIRRLQGEVVSLNECIDRQAAIALGSYRHDER